MKRFLAVLTLAFVVPFGGAIAADIPLKAPPVPIVSEYNWSGFYIGANGGWANSSFDWRYTNPAPATCCAPFSASASNGIVGLQAGAQIQWDHIVLGVEIAGDQFFNERFANGPGCVAPNSLTIVCQIRTN